MRGSDRPAGLRRRAVVWVGLAVAMLGGARVAFAAEAPLTAASAEERLPQPLSIAASAALALGRLVLQGIADDQARVREARWVSGYEAPPAASRFEAADYDRYRIGLERRDPYADARALIEFTRGEAIGALRAAGGPPR